MFEIDKYKIIDKIYESQKSIIYRASIQITDIPVVLKFLKKEFFSYLEISRYKQEYEIASLLESAKGTIFAYELYQHQNNLVIVLEDIGGKSLDILMKERAFTIEESLDIAIKIADGLAEIHAANIIHKNINPANIVYNPLTKQLKIIDFGSATRALSQTYSLKSFQDLEENLAYIAPEQTGRMNRQLDYRSDFYSLGATLYHFLTGQLPFPVGDIVELVHSHLAKQPIPPCQSNLAIPSAVSDLVMKLLAKTAENRYQSAWGIKADLEECSRQLKTSKIISPFALGQKDISDRFQISQKFYGREAETKALLAAFERVAKTEDDGQRSFKENSNSRIEIVLVSGDSGIGKSALVNKSFEPIARKRSYFLYGKFERLKRNIPYSALIRAFQNLIEQLLCERETVLKQWREKIIIALGNNGGAIAEVIPEIESIVGKQPPLPELPPLESQNRFNLVWQNLIATLAEPTRPLVIFLDNLQWADTASLKLLRSLIMCGSGSQSLLAIGTYRAREVSPTHPLMLWLDEIENLATEGSAAKVSISSIHLEPLNLTEVNLLLADTFNTQIESTKLLAELVLNKTEGNPLSIEQFLQTVCERGSIFFDRQLMSWNWDLKAIQASDAVENVGDLIAEKVQKLSEPTREILKLAACIGSRFELKILAIACQKSPSSVAMTLQEAVEKNLVLFLGENYQSLSRDPELVEELSFEYKFAHNRIQQAAYSLIAESDRPVTHQQIGRLLWQNLSRDLRQRYIFDIVDRLDRAIELVRTQTEKEVLAELNWQAGNKAKLAVAYEAAFNYFKTGVELLEPDSWERRYDLALNLHLSAAEAAYLSGNFDKVELWSRNIKQRAKTLLDIVKADEVRIETAIARGQIEKAIQIGKESLSLFGIDFPAHPTNIDIQSAFLQIRSKLARKPISGLIDLPLMANLEIKAAMQIIGSICSASYLTRPSLFPLTVLKMVELSIEYGHSDISPFAYAAYGVVLCGIFFDIDTGYEFGELALNLAEQLQAKSILARILFAQNNQIKVWKMHLRECCSSLQQCYQIGVDNGDLEFASYALMYVSAYDYFSGKSLPELKKDLERQIAALSNIEQIIGVRWLEICLQTVLNLRESSFQNKHLIGEAFDSFKLLEIQRDNARSALFFFHLNQLVSCYLLEEDALALKSAKQAELHIGATIGTALIGFFYFYATLNKLRIYRQASALEQKKIIKKIDLQQSKIKHWAKQAPMNYLHKYYLIEAEKNCILGENDKAIENYDLAIKFARKNGYLNEEALACELAAKFYFEQGKVPIAKAYIQEAYYGYDRWGATVKTKQIEEKYPQFFQEKIIQKNSYLDVVSILKASQAISCEIILETLLSKLIKIAIENAGAEKGCLIWRIRTESEAEEEWKIAAWCPDLSENVQVLPSIPIDLLDRGADFSIFPPAIINYAIRTRESVVLSDALKEEKFALDPYICQRQPRSILCTPIVYQSKLMGLIYLENNLIAGAFTDRLLENLNVLSSQVAISLENALLYKHLAEVNQKLKDYSRTLEAKVEERTAQLQAAKELADAANIAKSEFISRMSHELRTPLNAILGFARLMEWDASLSLEYKEHLGIIVRSGEHLLELINKILDMAKLDAGKMTVEENIFSLNRLLASLEEMFSQEAQSKQLSLKLERSSALPTYIQTDEKKLHRILSNLLSNAIQFTQRGSITLRSSFSSSRTLIFEVEDTGVGIAPEEIDSLFEPFSQTLVGRKTRQGTGLGLAIGRHFARLMGGEISLSSTPGSGTRVVLELPIEPLDLAAGNIVNEPPTLFPSREMRPQIELTPEMLEQMPADWILRLYQAANTADNEMIDELIARIPPEGEFLAEGLADLARNFFYERILDLTKLEEK